MKTKKPKRRRGRLAYYANSRAIASALNLPLDVVGRARDVGCPAFRGGRIHTDALLEWLGDRPELFRGTGEEALRRRRLEQQVRRLQLANDAREAQLVPRAQVCATIDRIIDRTLPELDRLLVDELPPRLVGLTVPDARKLCQDYSDKVRRVLYEAQDEWTA